MVEEARVLNEEASHMERRGGGGNRDHRLADLDGHRDAHNKPRSPLKRRTIESNDNAAKLRLMNPDARWTDQVEADLTPYRTGRWQPITISARMFPA